MIIDYNLTSHIVHTEDSLRMALNKIDANKTGMIFLVSNNNFLEGVLTDGDFRRRLLSKEAISLDAPASQCSNTHFISAHINEPHAVIREKLSTRVKILPLLDDKGHLVAFAHHGSTHTYIDGHLIGNEAPAFIIAEIGNNHNGSIQSAKLLVDAAIQAGADCVKFQMRDLPTLYVNNADPKDHSADLSTQYTLDLLEKFNLPAPSMIEIFDYCKSRNILCLCTPWDLKSLAILEEYGMPAFKIASADLTNIELLEAVAKLGKPTILSTGMSVEQEIEEAANVFKNNACPFILLHCNSTYPTPYKDIHLNYLQHLNTFSPVSIGYSGHERGYNIAVAAVSLGAKVIEKHFTLDRSLEGVDHKVSLLPNEFKAMVSAIRQVEQAMGSDSSRSISQGETINRQTLAKSLVAACPIEKGQQILPEMVCVKSPGKGLQPNKKKQLLGRIATRSMKEGEYFFESDIKGSLVSARESYAFKRPWGVPVRFHDAKLLLAKTNVDLLEYHLSYSDLDVDIKPHAVNLSEKTLIIHAPELFAGDHILDLCSENEEYRHRSIAFLQTVVNKTKDIALHCSAKNRPLIIVNVGGHTDRDFLSPSKKALYYERALDSLSKVDAMGVELLPQTMPPFPWHFGGQRFHNLFMAPHEIAEFCYNHDFRVCLDISHSKLACNHFGWSFSEFIEIVGPYAAHLHLSDAKGIDGEGLQIGEGEIDFPALAKQLNKVAPRAGFIPEIWQGHNNEGVGFWTALESLSSWF